MPAFMVEAMRDGYAGGHYRPKGSKFALLDALSDEDGRVLNTAEAQFADYRQRGGWMKKVEPKKAESGEAKLKRETDEAVATEAARNKQARAISEQMSGGGMGANLPKTGMNANLPDGNSVGGKDQSQSEVEAI